MFFLQSIVIFVNLIIDMSIVFVLAFFTLFACIHHDMIRKNCRVLADFIFHKDRKYDDRKCVITVTFLFFLQYFGLILWLLIAIRLGSVFMILLLFLSFSALPIAFLTVYLHAYSIYSIIKAGNFFSWGAVYPEWFLAVIDYFYISISFTNSS